jgi:hypothetical protein
VQVVHLCPSLKVERAAVLPLSISLFSNDKSPVFLDDFYGVSRFAKLIAMSKMAMIIAKKPIQTLYLIGYDGNRQKIDQIRPPPCLCRANDTRF